MPVQAQLPVSFLMVASVAAQGTYSREKVIRARAFKGPKPMVPREPIREVIPSGEVMLVTPKSTAQLETTTSLAEMPAIRATTICQKPRPMGTKKGTISRPIMEPKVWDMSWE